MFVQVTRLIWVGLCTFVLVFTLYHFGKPEDHGDLDLFFYWSMMMLSFPAGAVGGGLFFGVVFMLATVFPWLPYDNYYLSVLTWILFWFAFFIPGYIQWFKLVPYVFAKIRKRGNGAERSG